MITRLIWTIWTSLSTVLRKAIKFNHSLAREGEVWGVFYEFNLWLSFLPVDAVLYGIKCYIGWCYSGAWLCYDAHEESFLCQIGWIGDNSFPWIFLNFLQTKEKYSTWICYWFGGISFLLNFLQNQRKTPYWFVSHHLLNISLKLVEYQNSSLLDPVLAKWVMSIGGLYWGY